jgi:hypothetical protein
VPAVEPGTAAATGRRDVVAPLILIFAAIELATGAWMLIAPGSFFDNVGPFGSSNPHYTRDAGTFTLSLGLVLAIAYVRPGWRLGAVGYAFFQFLFHSVNHLVDIDKAHPHRYGPLDFASLAVGAAVLGWLLLQVLRQRGEGEP